MNFFDYLMQDVKGLSRNFILGHSESVSFKDLFDQSIRIAGYLEATYGKGRNILLVSPNSVFFISAYLGILKSGNVCVPADYMIEQSNFDYIAELTETPLVIHSNKMKEKLNFSGSYDVVDEELFTRRNFETESLKEESETGESLLAQIVFTSGSTGRPKGVMLSHKNLIANTESILGYLKLGENDRICNVLPFHYCYGLSLLHTHLKVGGSMVLNNNFMFLGLLIDDLKTFKCTGFSGVPSHYQILLKKSSFFSDDLPYLRYLTQAGGKLHNHFIQQICEAFPDKKFFVMYGQTEATARLSYLPAELALSKLGSIGKSIPGVELKIVDENNNEVQAGEEGELIARGDNIMIGYFMDEEETASTLKDGWLHTGDLAIKDEEGFFYVVGRKKEFIKVRGKRVSPNEIISVILSLADVVDCTIEKIEDIYTGEAIKANVVIKSGSDKDEVESKINEICRQKLASFKVPSVYTFSQQLNYSSAGKNRRN